MEPELFASDGNQLALATFSTRSRGTRDMGSALKVNCGVLAELLVIKVAAYTCKKMVFAALQQLLLH